MPRIQTNFQIASVIIVAIIYASSSLYRTYPIIAPDEEGIIFQAQYISGILSGNMGVAPYYAFGASLTYAPIFLLVQDPFLVYKAIMAVNAVMAALVVPFLVKIADILGYRGRSVVILAAILALWPAYFSPAHFAWSETAFRLAFVGSVCLLALFLERPTFIRSFGFGLAASLTYAIHPRATLIIPFAIMVLIGAMFMRRLNWRHAFFAICTIVICTIATHFIFAYLIEAVWEAGAQQQSERMLERFKSADILQIIAVVSGQAWYQIVSSLGFVVAGGVYLLRQIKTNNSLISIYILLSVVAVAGASVGQMLSPQRIDHLLYGRYIDGTSILIVWIGLLALSHRKSILVAPVAVLGAVFVAVALWTWSPIHELDFAHPNNIAGIGWIFWERAPLHRLLFWTSAGALTASLVIAYQRNRYAQIVILAFMVSCSSIFYGSHLYNQAQAVERGMKINMSALEPFIGDTIYWTDRSRHRLGLYHLQFAAGQHFELFDPETFSEGVVIDIAPPEGFVCVGELRGELKIYSLSGSYAECAD